MKKKNVKWFKAFRTLRNTLPLCRIQWILSGTWNPDLHCRNIYIYSILEFQADMLPYFILSCLPHSLNCRHRLKPKRQLRSSSGRWRSCGPPRRPSPWRRRGCWRRTAASLIPPGRKCSIMPHRGYERDARQLKYIPILTSHLCVRVKGKWLLWWNRNWRSLQ